MRIVLDTNVLVSAMMSGSGAPYFVLQLVHQRAVTLLADSRILAEYYEVTARAHFVFDQQERILHLDVLANIAEPVISSPLRVSLPDPDDRLFVEVALAGNADAIVTGSTRHLIPRKGDLRVNVLTPRQLVDRLRR